MARGTAASTGVDRALEFGRNADVAGEQIDRAERQHAERLAGRGEPLGGITRAAVPAADNDRVVIGASPAIDGARNAPPAREHHVDRAARSRKTALQLGLDLARVAVDPAR